MEATLFADDKIAVDQKVAPNVYFHPGDLDKEQLRARIDAIRARVIKNKRIERYVGKGFNQQIEKIYSDYTGKVLGHLDVKAEAAKKKEKK